jgi:cysteine desulfuration protein SufE
MSERRFEDIAADFEFLDDWEDRYRYLIELGKELPPFPDEARTEENRVHGCVSQVWILPEAEKPGTPEAVLHLRADSDALIVKGLIAVLLSMVSGKPAREILDMDIAGNLERLGLQEHLTPQRANGLKAMIQRIRQEARKALEGA